MLDQVRKDIIKLVYEKGESHIGSCLSCVEILLEIKAKMNAGDTFILSKAHAQRAVDVIGMEGGLPEASYGNSVGNYLAIALGMAICRPNNKIFILMGDGECAEGSVWEALQYIGKHHVRNMIILIDCNEWGAYQKVTVPWIDTLGFKSYLINGHDRTELGNAIGNDDEYFVPFIRCMTIKGKGISFLEGTMKSHYYKLSKEEYENIMR